MAKVFEVDYRRGSLVSTDGIIPVNIRIELVKTPKGLAITCTNPTSSGSLTYSKVLNGAYDIIAFGVLRSDSYFVDTRGTSGYFYKDSTNTYYSSSGSFSIWGDEPRIGGGKIFSMFHAASIVLNGTDIKIGKQFAKSRDFINKIVIYSHRLTAKEIFREYRDFLRGAPLATTPTGAELRKSTDLSRLKGTGGLVASYSFSPISTLEVDTSSNGKNATLTGCSRTKEGLRLNGTSDKVSLGNIGNVKSIQFRIKLSTTTQKIIEGAANSKLIYVNSGTLTASDFANKYVDGNSGSTMVAGLWQSVTLTSANDVAFTAATLGLNNTTYGAFEISDLRLWSKVVSSKEIRDFHNSFIKPVINEDFRYLDSSGNATIPLGWKTTGTIIGGQVTAQDSVLQSIKKGTKYVQINTGSYNGVMYAQSNIAYGTWEFSIYVATNNMIAIVLFDETINGQDEYGIQFMTGRNIDLYYWNGVYNVPFRTGDNYYENNKWYDFKITRRYDGLFTAYIRGGSFGKNYTLVTISGQNTAGTNPVTHNTTKKSVRLGAYIGSASYGSRITNIKVYPGIIV